MSSAAFVLQLLCVGLQTGRLTCVHPGAGGDVSQAMGRVGVVKVRKGNVALFKVCVTVAGLSLTCSGAAALRCAAEALTYSHVGEGLWCGEQH